MDAVLQRWCKAGLVAADKQFCSISDPVVSGSGFKTGGANVLRNQSSSQKRLGGSLALPNWSTESGSHDAHEWFVEAAAFLQLSKSRGVDVADRLGEVFSVQFSVFSDEPRGVEIANESGERSEILQRAMSFVKSLASTCPLTSSSPLEALGSMHEYLVSQRDRSATKIVERSPHSRKTGGVFYTPRHVIDYMIRQTLGQRLERSTPDRFNEIQILDPAAGCGAFLLQAFRFLIECQLQWFIDHDPHRWPSNIRWTEKGWQLTVQHRQSVLRNNLFGVDLDAAAIEVARRTVWLAMLDSPVVGPDSERETFDWNELNSNFKQGNSLIGSAFFEPNSEQGFPESSIGFDWSEQFPQVADRGGFDVIVGNPPYRRELNFKAELDRISISPLGRHRSPRMDLWYYFCHRGISLLRDGGSLSFITNAYWIHGRGSEKLIAALRDEVHLDELFLLRNQPVFPGVSGQHVIFRLTKSISDEMTTIKVAPHDLVPSVEPFFTGEIPVHTYHKTRTQLFSKCGLNVSPVANTLLKALAPWPKLSDLGIVRQGIAENPASINRRTLKRFENEQSARDWLLGEGVFSLLADEVNQLELSSHETELLRPYHDLCDLGRYWSANVPSRQLIYSTQKTCPVIDRCPSLHRHLSRFRPILEARRETRIGSNSWWHLHWPRDERIWRSKKLIALQMAARPSFVSSNEPTYVPFSANVFVPLEQTREDLRYLCGLLNSRVLWAWFENHAKHRGIGLDLNGNVLKQAPIRRIDFEDQNDVKSHDELIALVDERTRLQSLFVAKSGTDSQKILDDIQTIESRIDDMVATLYQLEPSDIELVNELTRSGTH